MKCEFSSVYFFLQRSCKVPVTREMYTLQVTHSQRSLCRLAHTLQAAPPQRKPPRTLRLPCCSRNSRLLLLRVESPKKSHSLVILWGVRCRRGALLPFWEVIVMPPILSVQTFEGAVVVVAYQATEAVAPWYCAKTKWPSQSM